MTLRQKQSKFVVMISHLIIFADSLGYELTFGESYDDDGIGHMLHSLHYLKLAQDFNLFQDGVYLVSTEDHLPLGEYWESIGGSWGGRFNDGNHYSLEHNGRK
jgi:hypothetical protein